MNNIITQEIVNCKLKEVGNKLLSKNYKDKWTKEKPTTGYCYIVSEAIYHFLSNENFHVYCINLGESIGTHWFLKLNEKIIDFTGNQFDFPIDYSKGKRIGFLKGGIKTSKGYISKRGYEIAQILELIKNH